MHLLVKFRITYFFCFLCVVWISGIPAVAGVSQAIQDDYKMSYGNKAMFLRIPIYAQKQYVRIEGRTFRAEPVSGSPIHKVGEQMRITRIDFGGDEIKFRLTAISSPAEAEIIFSFPVGLDEGFSGRDIFDRALRSTFTEGLSYSDIEQAKTEFLKDEFGRSVDQIAGATSLDRAVVLDKVAPLIPDYSKLQGQKKELDSRVETMTAQITELKDSNLKLESRLKESQSELSRAQNTNASMRESLDGSKVQVTKLEAELRNAVEKAQRYEREIQSVQRSLDSESNSNRDLTKNNAELGDRILALQRDLKEQQSESERLKGEVEDYKSDIGKLNSTIKTLTSNKDSIGRQYVAMKEEKEKLDEFAMDVKALSSRVVEEKTEGSVFSGKAGVYADNLLLGLLVWEFPAYLNYGQERSCQATFMAESIDPVKVTPDQRQILRTLGEKTLKIKMNLVSLSPEMSVASEGEQVPHEVAERENSTWSWQVKNGGAQDAAFLLTAHLVNRNAQDIPVFEKKYTVETSTLVRRIRSYLEPVPIAIGVILGFLLFGVVGIFRKPKPPKQKRVHDSGAGSQTYTNQKQL